MANHKSAAKRARQSLRRATRRSAYKSSVKTLEKKLRKSITGKETEAAQKLLKEFASKIDKASKTNIVHPRAASRKISRLSAAVSSLK